MEGEVMEGWAHWYAYTSLLTLGVVKVVYLKVYNHQRL